MRRFSGTVLIVALLASVPIMLELDQAAASSHPLWGWTSSDQRALAIEMGALELRESRGTDNEPRERPMPTLKLKMLVRLKSVSGKAEQNRSRTVASKLREAREQTREKAQERYLRTLAHEVRKALPSSASTEERWRRMVEVYGEEGALSRVLSTNEALLQEVRQLGWEGGVTQLEPPVGMEHDPQWQVLYIESLLFDQAGGWLR